MKMHHVSRISSRHHCGGVGSYGSRLFYLNHIIAMLFFSLKIRANMECISNFVLIGNNSYHCYLSPLAVVLVATMKPGIPGGVKYQ